MELVADLRSLAASTAARPGCVAGVPAGKAHLTLVESVRQDRRKGLTLFEQEFVERRGQCNRAAGGSRWPSGRCRCPR